MVFLYKGLIIIPFYIYFNDFNMVCEILYYNKSWLLIVKYLQLLFFLKKKRVYVFSVNTYSTSILGEEEPFK